MYRLNDLSMTTPGHQTSLHPSGDDRRLHGVVQADTKPREAWKQSKHGAMIWFIVIMPGNMECFCSDL